MSLNVKTCKRCRRPYQFMGKFYCPQCVIDMDEIMVKIRDYLDESPNAMVEDIANDLQIESKDILQLMRDGRVMMHADHGGLQCEICGKSIGAGKMCNDCMADLGKSIQGRIIEKMKEKQEADKPKDDGKKKNNRMHVKF